MSKQILMFTSEREPVENVDELQAGLLYNACYMFEWQVRRCQRGTWDAFSERLLRAGVKTARGVIQHGKSYGRFDKPTLLRLIVEAEKLLTEERKAA